MTARGVETLIHYPVPIPPPASSGGVRARPLPDCRPHLRAKSCRCRCIRACRDADDFDRGRGRAAFSSAEFQAGRSQLVVLSRSDGRIMAGSIFMRRTLLTVALSVFGGACLRAAVKLAFTTAGSASMPPRCRCGRFSTSGPKIGGTKIVGAERITGAPLTLKLVDVPEAQALEIILRSVAGYMAAPRGADARRVDRTIASSSWRRAPVPAPAPPPTPARPATRPTADQRHAALRSAASASGRAGGSRTTEMRSRIRIRRNPPVFTFPQPGQPRLRNSQPARSDAARRWRPRQPCDVTPADRRRRRSRSIGARHAAADDTVRHDAGAAARA